MFALGVIEILRRYGESKAHEIQKERIGQILREHGWNVYVDNMGFDCQTSKGLRTYWPDIYAESFCRLSYTKANRRVENGARRIIVEVQGPGSHHSKLARGLDNGRRRSILEHYGPDIQWVEVYLGRRKSPNDIRNWTTRDICEELRL